MTIACNCTRCGLEIPRERLEILPDTRLCVECVRAVKGEFHLYSVAGQTNKANSLKKNIGSYSLLKVRKAIRPLNAPPVEEPAAPAPKARKPRKQA